MTRVLHVFDEHSDWEQRVAVRQLLDRLRPESHDAVLATVAGQWCMKDWFGDRVVHHAPARMGLAFLAAPSLRRLIDAHQIDVVHAWGESAAEAAVAARLNRCPLVVTRFDPRISDRKAKLLRTIAQGPRSAVCCSSETVQRRLVERGVPIDRCVLVRPGVDFAAINAAKNSPSIRADLGIDSDKPLLVASCPMDHSSGHEFSIWAAQLTQYIDGGYCMVVRGDSAEYDRVKRLSMAMPFHSAVEWVGTGCRYEQLLSIGAVHVVTPYDDVSSTSIAWSMAAGVPVIGSAVYSVAELIAHRHNGVLIKPREGPTMSVAILRAIMRIEALAKETETARAQAYEVFGVRRFVDQQLRVYENLIAGLSATDGVRDSATL